MVIIAASGMAEAGRILHHLAHGARDPRNTILIVGFQAEHTLGRRIVERQPMLEIFGEEVPLRARVEVLNGYSAHADRHELQAGSMRCERQPGQAARRVVHLVHGEPEAQDAFAAQLTAAGYPTVDAPEPHTTYRAVTRSTTATVPHPMAARRGSASSRRRSAAWRATAQRASMAAIADRGRA